MSEHQLKALQDIINNGGSCMSAKLRLKGHGKSLRSLTSNGWCTATYSPYTYHITEAGRKAVEEKF